MPLLHHLSRRTFLLGLTAATLLAPRSASAADYVMAGDFATNPAPHIAFDSLKSLRVTKTVLVPTLYLRVGAEGSVFASKGIGGSTASAKGTFTVLGLEKAALQKLSTQLYDNFVQRLRADGWTVLTYDDVKDDPEVVKMERRAGDSALSLPVEKSPDGRTTYALVTPSDAQNIKPAMQGLHWTFRTVGAARNATILVPSVDVVAPQIWAETRKGYSSASAKINSAPGMNMNYGMVIAFTPKGGGGVIAKMKYAIVNASENAGTFVDAKDKSPSAANGLSKALGILGGGGSISRASAAYTFQIDPAAFDTGVLRGGGGFLDGVAKAMAAEKP